jgi:hypothetical protein
MPDFSLGSKAGFHSSEGDDGAHLEVQVVVVGGGEDAEQRRRCWKQIGVAGSGNLTNTSRARRKIDSSSALFFRHFVEQVVGVLLGMVRWLQLGDCNAVGSKPRWPLADVQASVKRAERWQ